MRIFQSINLTTAPNRPTVSLVMPKHAKKKRFSVAKSKNGNMTIEAHQIHMTETKVL